MEYKLSQASQLWFNFAFRIWKRSENKEYFSLETSLIEKQFKLLRTKLLLIMWKQKRNRHVWIPKKGCIKGTGCLKIPYLWNKIVLLRKTSESAVSASAPKRHMLMYKWQSPLVVEAIMKGALGMVVIMKGAKAEKRWCYYRATKSVQGRGQKSQQTIKLRRLLFIFPFQLQVNIAHGLTLTLTTLSLL